MSDVVPVRRALLSVSDKTGLVELGRGLANLGVAIVSSGTTARTLADAGIEVMTVSEVTAHPEILEGRVKTLHPKIHGGILADRRKPEHLRQIEELGIEPFDLVVVNLYPFRETVASGADADEIVEQIDIGGPALVRAAAKNFESVAVVTGPETYERLLGELRDSGGLAREMRRDLAAKAFEHTAAYDAAVAAWFAEEARGDLPPSLVVALEKVADLRYGENPHQRAALYRTPGGPGPLHGARVLQGKEMSFNNWLDAEAAVALAAALPEPAVAIIKHNNPCGVALGDSLDDAYRRALECDPMSAYGGIVAVNTELDEATARAIGEVFTEVVVAPSLSAGARGFLGEKKNLRLLTAPIDPATGPDIRMVPDGALVQDRDAVTEGQDDMKVATTRQPSEEEWPDLLFAWVVAARVRSNAIVLARDRATVGIGAGQMSRVDPVEIAARKAGDRAAGSVMASEALFPFRDGIDAAGVAGVTAVIHPGGSIRDEEILQAAEEHGMAMVLTGRRHFRH